MTKTEKMSSLTEAERELLRLAHWPIDPPADDDKFKRHDRIEAAVARIVNAREEGDLPAMRNLLERIERHFRVANGAATAGQRRRM